MRTNAASLRGALRVLKQLVVQKPALPVLGQIRVEAKESQLAVEATDIDSRLRLTMPAVEDLSPVLLPFKRFASLLDAAGAKYGTVELTLAGRRLSVGVNGRNFSLDTSIPAEEFPAPIPGQPRMQSVVYDKPSGLADALEWLLPAVGIDMTRPMLTGLSFNADALIGCDGHRLHLVKGLPRVGTGAMLPANAARTLAAFIRAFEPLTVECALGEGVFVFSAAIQEVGFSMTSKAVEAEFPDYADVIPRSDSTGVELSVSQLGAALALASKVSGSGYAKLQLNGALVIEASDVDDGGSIREEVEVQRVHGDAEVQVGLNLAFLRDALTTEGATAILGMSDEASPITVRFPDDEQRLAVIMPVRL